MAGERISCKPCWTSDDSCRGHSQPLCPVGTKLLRGDTAATAVSREEIGNGSVGESSGEGSSSILLA